MIDIDSLDNETFSSWSFLPCPSIQETNWNGREISFDSRNHPAEVTKVFSQKNLITSAHKQSFFKEKNVSKIDSKTPFSANGREAPNGTILGGILIIGGAIVWCFSPPAGMNLIRIGVGSILAAEGENLVGIIKKK